MKKSITLIIISIYFLLLVGCNNPEDQYTWLDKYEELEQLSSWYDVLIEVEDSDLKEGVSQISVNWSNKMNKEMMFGNAFTIVKEVNGEWNELKYSRDELEFVSIGIILDENKTIVEKYDLSLFDDKFKEGQYKFISSIFIDHVEYLVEADFVID